MSPHRAAVPYDVRWRPLPGAKEDSKTFSTRRAAERFKVSLEASLQDGTWVDPARGRVSLRDYTAEVLADRHLRTRTRETYEGQLRLHILPVLGSLPMCNLTPAAVRRWRNGLLRSELSPNTVAKCYRLLNSICTTAVEDGLIGSNPCSVPKGGVERAAERPTASVEEIWAAADAMPDHLRIAVILAGFVGLRTGELLGLERRHINPLRRNLSVEQQESQLRNGTLEVGPPKTNAGIRPVSLPETVLDELAQHLDRFVGDHPGARVLTGEKGGPLRRHVLFKYWKHARTTAGLPDTFRFHDLRHTAHTLAAQAGATTKELMHRMGHSTPAASLRYQHAAERRDELIARNLNAAIAPQAKRRRRRGTA